MDIRHAGISFDLSLLLLYLFVLGSFCFYKGWFINIYCHVYRMMELMRSKKHPNLRKRSSEVEYLHDIILLLFLFLFGEVAWSHCHSIMTFRSSCFKLWLLDILLKFLSVSMILLPESFFFSFLISIRLRTHLIYCFLDNKETNDQAVSFQLNIVDDSCVHVCLYLWYLLFHFLLSVYSPASYFSCFVLWLGFLDSSTQLFSSWFDWFPGESV